MSIVERFYFWPSNPAASIFTLWVLSQIFLYAARVPMHRALREVGRLLGGAFRIGARWCRGLATVASRRDHEMIVEMGKGDTEAKIGREFHRIEGFDARRHIAGVRHEQDPPFLFQAICFERFGDRVE